MDNGNTGRGQFWVDPEGLKVLITPENKKEMAELF